MNMTNQRILLLTALTILLFSMTSCGKNPFHDTANASHSVLSEGEEPPRFSNDAPSSVDAEDVLGISDGGTDPIVTPSAAPAATTGNPPPNHLKNSTDGQEVSERGNQESTETKEDAPSQTDRKPLGTQYMRGEFWMMAGDSADLLPLETDETPASYFERIQSQAAAEAERYILKTCLPDLEDFQETYGGTKTGDTFYQGSRIDNLEPAGVFCKDGTRYLVYILDYSVHLAPGTQLFLAGGMSIDNDRWMDPGLWCILALSLENDESIQLSFGYQSDLLPDNQEFFQQDFSAMLAQHQMGQEDN